jgi:hypothetical protein
MGEARNAYRILVGKSNGERHFDLLSGWIIIKWNLVVRLSTVLDWVKTRPYGGFFL